MLLTYRASKRTGSIRPAKIVGATAQYLKYHHVKRTYIFPSDKKNRKENGKFNRETSRIQQCPDPGCDAHGF